MTKKIKKYKKGFVLFIAMMTSSLLISIGFFIAFVSEKELVLAQSAKETQRAFYAADTAIECALYQDFRVSEFRRNSAHVNFPQFILCNDDGTSSFKLNYKADISLANPASGGDNGLAISYYEGSLSNDLNNQENEPYVRIKITKIDVGGANDKTTIEAWGHNLKKSSSALVERALKVEY